MVILNKYHGLLHIELLREIPDALKPRKIAIQSGQPTAVLTQQAAANTALEQDAVQLPTGTN